MNGLLPAGWAAATASFLAKVLWKCGRNLVLGGREDRCLPVAWETGVWQASLEDFRESVQPMRHFLPEFYRENPGTVVDLADLAEARQRALRGEMHSRRAALDLELTSRESRPDGRGGREWLADRAWQQPRLASHETPTRVECHRTLSKWFEARVGKRPVLMARAQFERVQDGQLKLRLSETRSVVGAWYASDGVQMDHLAVPDAELTRGLPVGLRIQLAVLGALLPRNPHVEGLTLQGVYSELWV